MGQAHVQHDKPYAFSNTMRELVFDIRFMPSRSWPNILPGFVVASYPDEFRGVSLFPHFESAIDELGPDEQVIPLPFTFLLHASEGFEIGIQRDWIVANTRPGYFFDGDAFIASLLKVIDANIRTSHPRNFARVAIKSTHRIPIPYDEHQSVNVKDILEIQPRTGPRLPTTHAGFVVSVDVVREQENMVSTIQLETHGINVEEQVLVALLSIDCVIIDAARLGMEELTSLTDWLDAAFRSIHDDYAHSLKPGLADMDDSGAANQPEGEVQS